MKFTDNTPRLKPIERGRDMHITQITFKGIRGYSEQVEFNLSPRTNYFVEENNSGKISILDAIAYLRNDTKTSKETFTLGLDESFVEAALAFTDDEAEHSLGNDYAKLEQFFNHDRDSHPIHIRNQSNEDTVINSTTNKPSTITTKNIIVRNPGTHKFENPTGIAALAQRLFDTRFNRSSPIIQHTNTAWSGSMRRPVTSNPKPSKRVNTLESGRTQIVVDMSRSFRRTV